MALKLKEAIKVQAARFAQTNKESSVEELQTVLVRKETLDEDDKGRHRYYQQVVRLHQECLKGLKARC